MKSSEPKTPPIAGRTRARVTRSWRLSADDDGVCVVRRRDASRVLEQCTAREAKEATVRKRLKAGELGLDIYDMRARLAERGLQYHDELPAEE